MGGEDEKRAASLGRAFISHSSADDRYVTEFERFVRGLGYGEVFNDGHAIEPDEAFWERVEDGIRQCDAFVVVLSLTSVKSVWVDREVELARAEGKRVLPVRIDDCQLPESFDGRDVVDLRRQGGERFKLAPSRILRHSPEKLFGRESWLDALDAAWALRDSVHVYTLVAWGGVGKTSLVAHWVAERLAAKGWPEVERYFDWSFYSQGTGESRQTSSDFFISEALTFFGDPDPTVGSPWDRGQRLADLARKHCTLLVLDGIEPLQYPPNDPQAGRLKDEGLAALLQSLAADNPGLCVVTTRESLTNLESYRSATAPEKKLDKLPKEAAIALLRHLEITGTEEEMAASWEETGGHALTLQLLGRFLADAHGGDIRLRKEVNFEEADRETQGRSAVKVMRAYERWLKSAGPERQRELAILRLTGLFDRPISPDCLQALRAEPVIESLTASIAPLTDPQWNIALKRLLSIDLLAISESSPGDTQASIDAHPLIREYFAQQLREQQPKAFKAAHARLFDHLCERTEHQPDTLEGLQPLYQAVIHGCLAGRQQEARENVYRDRILRHTGPTGQYSTRELGAIGANLAAVAAFFDQPWSRLSPNLAEANQAWLLNEAAFFLRALGRLTDAMEPMRAGLEMRIRQKVWKSAAIIASNLSELEVTLGRLGEAVDDARRAIDFADRSGALGQRVTKRVTAADALHQSGERDEAHQRFEEAEAVQCESQPEDDLLYGIAGFRYCDLLLAPAERAAWQHGSADIPVGEIVGRNADATDAFAEVKRRAMYALPIATNHGDLLSIALDQLTLARVALYRALLDPSETPPANPHLQAALDGLRQAGTTHHIPKALLTTTLHHHVIGDPDVARRDLDEAQQIAERGPMPLYLADVHLHRARLFRDKAELTKARALIEKHGYWRRREELADAEAASAHWS